MTLLQKTAAGFLFLLLAGQGIYLAQHTGQTVDEAYYNGISYPIVRYNDYSNLTEHPPLMMQLAGLPLLALQPHYPYHDPVLQQGNLIDIARTGDKFLYQSGNQPYQILFFERLMITGVTFLLALALFAWARNLFGAGGALLALSLLAFDPNLLAHGSLLTTDAGAAAFFFIAVWRLDRLFANGSRSNTILAGLACGLALLTKISTLILYPLSILFFIQAGRQLQPADKTVGDPAGFNRLLFAAAVLLFALAAGQKVMLALLGPVCVLALRLAWPAESAARRGRAFAAVREGISIIGWAVCAYSAWRLMRKQVTLGAALTAWTAAAGFLIFMVERAGSRFAARDLAQKFCVVWLTAFSVLALAYTDYSGTLLRGNPFKFYVENFLETFAHTRSGHLLYVPGSFITCDWKYFPAAILVKTPAGTLLLALAGVIILALRPAANGGLLRIITLLLPPLAFLAAASFLNTIKIGLRHVLPVYPFLFLAAGAVVPVMAAAGKKWSRAVRTIVIAAALAVPAEALREFPDYLSFFNFFAGGSENGVRLLGDSNFNWGQDNRRLAEFIKARGLTGVRIAARTLHAAEYDYAGIDWRPMQEAETVQPPPGWYALDREEYERHQAIADSWFRGRPPDVRIGKTQYLFKAD